MPPFGFCGPSYTSQSPVANNEMTMNWYNEIVEISTPRQGYNRAEYSSNRLVLYPCPGSAIYVTLPTGPVRGEFQVNGRMFAVGGGTLYEITDNGLVGIPTALGNVGNDGGLVSWASSPNQLLVASAQLLYVYNLQSGVFTAVPKATIFPVSQVGYSDGFFVAVIANSQIFALSSVLDATTWDPAVRTQVSVFSDNINSMIVDHREIWLFGGNRSVAYFNSGAPNFPYEPNLSSFMEQGVGAIFSTVRLDNTVFGLGSNEQGEGIAWRLNGYIPSRVSNHAVEFAWSRYPTRSDAIGYTQVDQGHSLYWLYFPSVSKTWVYDLSTRLWHERAFWDSSRNLFTAHRSQCHVSCFGKHLFGDWNSSNIYRLDINLYDDFGNAIRRVRRCPGPFVENEWTYTNELEIIMETGLGLTQGQGSDPQAMLRWSKDSGKTWSNEFQLSAGKIGEYKRRMIKRRLGRARQRVWELSVTDPIPWRVIDAIQR